MRHFVSEIEDAAEIDAFLRQPDVAAATATARSVLIQLFSARRSHDWIASLTQRLHSALPTATVVGASSSGEIAQGKTLQGATVLSLLCFNATELHPRIVTSRRGAEFATGDEIATTLSGLQNLRGILLLAPPAALDCARLLDGIEARLPGVTVFGGGAAAEDTDAPALVFGQGKILASGVIAVGLCGETLRIETDLLLGWEGLGPTMTLTDVDHNRIRTIDGRPAIDIYRRYLNIEPGDELFLLEFPLLLERDGHTLARNPLYSDAQGAVTLVADVHSGECARFGYLDIDTVIETVRGSYAAIQAFRPDALLLYSCVCRRFSLQQDVELEIAPFQRLAPVAGFFTYGEFARRGNGLQLLNSSQVVVAMREGGGETTAPHAGDLPFAETDHFRTRHLRVTSRLFQFVSVLTEELEKANRQLQHQAEHDALTGAYNRHRLEPAMKTELSRAERHHHPLSLVMFDVDHFKRVNDQLGHATGDYVLQALVQAVRKRLRTHDAVFRYGGEEFLILLPEVDLEGAAAVAEKARAEIAATALLFKGEPLPRVTVSFGVASAPRHGRTLRELLETVDSALYRAKQSGRNRVVIAPHQGENEFNSTH